MRVFYMETEPLKVFLCAPSAFSAIKDFKRSAAYFGGFTFNPARLK